MSPSSVNEIPSTELRSPVKTTIREPSTSRLRLGDLPTYGPVIRALASRDLKARYKQSALGPAWIVFQPLAMLAAFSVGFRSVAHVHTGGVPYALFALTGLVVWSYFQAVTMLSVASIVNNYTLVRWTACPRLALPLATLVSNAPSFAVPAIAAIVAAAVEGYLWVGTLLFPIMCVWLLLFVAIMAVLLSSISVRARDVMSVVPFLLQVVLFLSPVAYRTSALPSVLRALISVNPLTGLIDGWRWCMLGMHPDMTAVSISLAFTLMGLVVAWRFFARAEVRMADEI